jgi:hypothetical protein
MKKLILGITLFLIGFAVMAQTKLYENPKFDEITKNHKIIAVLPLKTTVKLRPKDMKQMSSEQLKDLEIKEGENIQFAMYSWFLKRISNGKMGVEVQDASLTNTLLKQKGINYDNIDTYTSVEIAKILGVDAVISGKFETNKPMSEGATVALAIFTGVSGPTNKAIINLFIHNGADGALLVNYNKAISGSLGSSTEDLINILLRKASRRITYTK